MGKIGAHRGWKATASEEKGLFSTSRNQTAVSFIHVSRVCIKFAQTNDVIGCSMIRSK